MAAGFLHFTIVSMYLALLLLGFSLHDVEASSCERHVHKKVGDTVELSSCLPSEGVADASWHYGRLLIADKDWVVNEKQFRGRLELNPTKFSLTVRGLTLQDSGDFNFVSAVNDKQRESVTVRLHVHESITKGPVLTSNSTWHASNESCTVSLECIAATDSSVSYSWTVNNQTFRGFRLQYIIQPEDGDIEFTCTISNRVSEKSAVKTWKCINSPGFGSSYLVPLVIGLVIGLLLIIVLVLSVLLATKSKDPCCNRVSQAQTVNQDETPQQVYSSLLHGDACVYETITGSAGAGTGEVCVYEEVREAANVGC